jgi:hypothetical protein
MATYSARLNCNGPVPPYLASYDPDIRIDGRYGHDVAAYFVLRADLARRGIAAKDSGFAEVLIAIPGLAGIVGAKLYHVLEDPRVLLAHPGELISQYGLAWFGGLAAGAAAFIWVARSCSFPRGIHPDQSAFLLRTHQRASGKLGFHRRRCSFVDVRGESNQTPRKTWSSRKRNAKTLVQNDPDPRSKRRWAGVHRWAPDVLLGTPNARCSGQPALTSSVEGCPRLGVAETPHLFSVGLPIRSERYGPPQLSIFSIMVPNAEYIRLAIFRRGMAWLSQCRLSSQRRGWLHPFVLRTAGWSGGPALPDRDVRHRADLGPRHQQ